MFEIPVLGRTFGSRLGCGTSGWFTRRPRYRARVMAQELILTFHGLGEPPASATQAERDVWVDVGWFEAIVDALPATGVGLAFDDGNSSDIEHALKVLLQRGRSARFFVLAGKLDAEGYLSAEDVRKLHFAGMGIGSHGLHHRDWRTLTESELDEELVVSRRLLGEVLKSDVGEAACPFGSYDRRVLRALRGAGYRRVYNSDDGPGPAGSWLAPRTTVHRARPLPYWLALAASGARRPGAKMVGKRLYKRLR
jgi:peptidoglycan/xylan/chitin deacetylase (PgdA/CDA1 family)